MNLLRFIQPISGKRIYSRDIWQLCNRFCDVMSFKKKSVIRFKLMRRRDRVTNICSLYLYLVSVFHNMKYSQVKIAMSSPGLEAVHFFWGFDYRRERFPADLAPGRRTPGILTAAAEESCEGRRHQRGRQFPDDQEGERNHASADQGTTLFNGERKTFRNNPTSKDAICHSKPNSPLAWE